MNGDGAAVVDNKFSYNKQKLRSIVYFNDYDLVTTAFELALANCSPSKLHHKIVDRVQNVLLPGFF